MIHPSTKVSWLDDVRGYGVVATRDIPKGTITYIIDELERKIGVDDPLRKDPRYQKILDRYCYDGPGHELILSWDHAKYMNHCCHPNTLTTGYGFEIAIVDIAAGQELTDDYGLFTSSHTMEISCAKGPCRLRIDSRDYEALVPQWNQKVEDALKSFFMVEQPLVEFVESEAMMQLEQYARSGKGYISVDCQRPF